MLSIKNEPCISSSELERSQFGPQTMAAFASPVCVPGLPDHVCMVANLEEAEALLRSPRITAVLLPSSLKYEEMRGSLRSFVESADVPPRKGRNLDVDGVRAYLSARTAPDNFAPDSSQQRQQWLEEMSGLTEFILRFSRTSKVIDVLFANDSVGPLVSTWHLDNNLLVVGVDYHSAGMQFVANSQVVPPKEPFSPFIEVNADPIYRVPAGMIGISKGTSFADAARLGYPHGLIHRRPPATDPILPYTHRMLFLASAELKS